MGNIFLLPKTLMSMQFIKIQKVVANFPIVHKTEVTVIHVWWRHNFNNYGTSRLSGFMIGKRSVVIFKVK